MLIAALLCTAGLLGAVVAIVPIVRADVQQATDDLRRFGAFGRRTLAVVRVESGRAQGLRAPRHDA
jgi:hypothetical protein